MPDKINTFYLITFIPLGYGNKNREKIKIQTEGFYNKSKVYWQVYEQMFSKI